MASAVRMPQLGRTIFLCCDIQERFRPLIHQFPSVVQTAVKMVKAARILEVPLVITEQYPKALGRTVTELEGSKPALLVDKLQFSMMVPAVNTFLNEQNPKIESAVLFGIESHVCVLQTALDALALGLNVHILADGVSSSQQTEIPIALERMKEAGCAVTTSDSVLFQLVRGADHKRFKDVSQIVKESMQHPLHNALLKL